VYGRSKEIIPDGEDASGLGKTSLLLDTSNSLLQDRGHFGRGGLGVGSISTDLLGRGVEGGRGSISGALRKDSDQRVSHTTTDTSEFRSFFVILHVSSRSP
jgi:hypothetical protein